jgi:hypothetical protein
MDAQDYISTEEVRRALKQYYRGDIETNLKSYLLESLADELKPIDEKGHWKPSPLVILTFLLLFALAGLFLYFSIGVRG